MYDIEKLNMAIMNIPCNQSHVYFGTAGEYYAYKEGHKEARHAAVEAVLEHFKAVAEPSVAAGDERAMFEVWYSENYTAHVPRMLEGQYKGEYVNSDTQAIWHAWQARAALASKYDVGVVQSPAVSQKDGAAVETKCKTCGGMGIVDDGEIDCYQSGEPFENGPVKCVKDCPDCTPAATVDAPADTTTASASIGDDTTILAALACIRSTGCNKLADALKRILDAQAQRTEWTQPSQDAASLDGQKLRREIGKASIGACSCGSKGGPLRQNHAYGCRYRALDAAMEFIDQQEALANSGASHAANAGEDTERERCYACRGCGYEVTGGRAVGPCNICNSTGRVSTPMPVARNIDTTGASHEAMARLCEERAMHWQQIDGPYAAGKKAGALDCAELIRAAIASSAEQEKK